MGNDGAEIAQKTTGPSRHDVEIPVEMLLAVAAKVLCSAVFTSGRDPEEAFRNSAATALHAVQLPDAMSRIMRWQVDRDDRRVDMSVQLDSASAAMLVEAARQSFPDEAVAWQAEAARLAALGEVTRSARNLGNRGSIIIPRDNGRRLYFEPVQLDRGPAPSAGWLPARMRRSRGDGESGGSLRARVGQVLDSAFADTDACHAAVLVVSQGDIVGERYGEGVHADMPLESWSMGKTVMSTLIGLLVGRGLLELDAPAPLAAWQGLSDPRGNITLRHLLNMSSGLACVGHDEPRHRWKRGIPEHFEPYCTAIDAARFATDRPAEFAPGEIGRYRNCDTLALATIYHDVVSNRLGADPVAWAQEALFDRLGMHGLVNETDRWGRFVISGFNYGTARDWARLGHLYLHDGVWDGHQVLSRQWVDFALGPAPAWPGGVYGAQVWRNADGAFPLPDDTIYMAGGGGQYVFVVPSRSLVIVRQGHSRGWRSARANVGKLLRELTAAL